jgi:hypothetical protein
MTSSSVDVYQQQKYQQKQFDILKSLPVHIRKNVILSHFLSISVWLVGEHYAGVIGYIAGGGKYVVKFSAFYLHIINYLGAIV